MVLAHRLGNRHIAFVRILCCPGARRAAAVAALALIATNAWARQRTDGPPADLIASAGSLFHQYGLALSQGARDRIPFFYHWQGAQIVFNGQARFQTRAELTERYRTGWTPPAFFAWDSLHFEIIPPANVLAIGRFKWLRRGTTDTLRFAYVALLTAVDSGMAIRVEHETRLP